MPHRYNNALASGIAPDPLLTYSEWANERFSLPRESTAEYGRYRTSRTPWVEEPLDELSPNSKTEVVVVIKPTQLAGTTIALVFLCGMIDMYPGPALMFLPTDSMARAFSKKKLSPAVAMQDSLKAKIRPPRSRDASNTILAKEFPGGSLMLTGSNSGASYRSESIKYLILDDFDEFEMDVAGQGSPEELADRRTGSFPGRKIYINSTTTDKETSNIENAFAASSQGYFSAPCPHCGHYQYLRWGGADAEFGIKFTRNEHGQVVDAWYQCECCRQRINEYEKPWMCENAKYIHKYPERKVRGFRWNALVTPLGWVNSWAYIAEKFLEANKLLKQGDPSKYKAWLNTFMSEPYEEPGVELEWETLQAREEPYKQLTIPMGGLMLVAGLDTQDDRIAVYLDAYGKGQESWTIYYDEIIGDPNDPEIWQQVDTILYQTYPHESGVELMVEAAAIDSQGHRTQAVYNYCRPRFSKAMAIQGASTKTSVALGRPKPMDVNWKGKVWKKGVYLWTVGTEVIKDTIHSFLSQNNKGPGYIHFPMGMEDEFYKMLCGEKRVTTYKDGRPVQKWKQKRPRVEAWDCKIYAYAAALRLGIANMTDDGWERRREAILGQKSQKDQKGQDKPAAAKKKLSVKSSFMGGR